MLIVFLLLAFGPDHVHGFVYDRMVSGFVGCTHFNDNVFYIIESNDDKYLFISIFQLYKTRV